MEIAAKTAIESTGGKVLKGTGEKFKSTASKIEDVFKRRYTEVAEDGTKKIKTKKALRDSVIAFGLTAAAYLGLGAKAKSSSGEMSGEMPPRGH